MGNIVYNRGDWLYAIFIIFSSQVHNISTSSTRYMTIPPFPSRLDIQSTGTTSTNPDYLNYPQYIGTSKQQIQFAQEMRQQLNQAAVDVVLGHNISANK